tara:strand:- start:6055 stop:6876 length:822 start_codon:yes stop_codon:yes gene_type:complete
MEIIVCGSGVGRFSGSRAGSGWLIGAKSGYTLFDCGPGVALRISDNEIPFDDIKAIFISHLHFDHVQGIGELLTQYEAADKQPPIIYGPPGVKDYVGTAVKWSNFQFENRETSPKNIVRCEEIFPEMQFDVNGYSVVSVSVPHSPTIQARSYKISNGTQSVVYSGDTPYVPEILVPFTKGSDVLIHEAHSLEALNLHADLGSLDRAARIKQVFPSSHTRVTEAAKIAQSSGVKKLILSHLLPTETEHTLLSELSDFFYDGEIVVPNDGSKIQI